ncbi:hypothetical protein GCM10007908_03260 [Rhizobium albus]|nr:hypothetical protein GCM10007908_03260 [Rhizobium albus]
MKIERAVREQTFTLTSIAGPSGSGKTYSALLYARGLVGPEGKVGFIDTENKRSRFYADVAGGFDVIDMDPPFTSQRYIEAIRALEAAGYRAIVIDSISHEWEGTGGVLEQAELIEQKTNRAGLHCWQKPKAGHKKLMNELLQTKAHLIFCCRVKEKVVQVKGQNGKTEIVNEGFVVVQEKSFIYEMTVSMMLSEGDHVPTIQKCPGDLESAFPTGRPVTIDAGKSVRAWSEQGREIDQELEASKREGLEAANKGMKALMTWWTGLGKPRQLKLEGLKDTFKSIATAADQITQDVHDAGGGDTSDRLKQARAASGEPGDEREGFDRSKVNEMTSSLSTSPNSDDSPSRTVSDDAGDSSAPAEQDGDDDIPSQSSPSDQSELEGAGKERDVLIRYASAMLTGGRDCIGVDKEKATDKLTKMHAVWKNTYFTAFSEEGIEQAQTVFRSAQAIAADKTSYESAVEFFEEMLDCPGKIGGA